MHPQAKTHLVHPAIQMPSQLIPENVGTVMHQKQATTSKMLFAVKGPQTRKPCSDHVLFLKLIFVSSNTLEISLKNTGHLIARMHSLTANLDDTILKTYETPGAEDLFIEYEYVSLQSPMVAAMLTSTSVIAMKAIYVILDRHHHSILLHFPSSGTEVVRTPLENGRRDAHNQDVRLLKQRITSIYSLNDLPAEKSSWGFYHDQTAMLLHPINVEIDSTQWYVSDLNQNVSSFL